MVILNRQESIGYYPSVPSLTQSHWYGTTDFYNANNLVLSRFPKHQLYRVSRLNQCLC